VRVGEIRHADDWLALAFAGLVTLLAAAFRRHGSSFTVERPGF